MMIPIGANKDNITAKVAKYFFRMYLSIMFKIVEFYRFTVESIKQITDQTMKPKL